MSEKVHLKWIVDTIRISYPHTQNLQYFQTKSLLVYFNAKIQFIINLKLKLLLSNVWRELKCKNLKLNEICQWLTLAKWDKKTGMETRLVSGIHYIWGGDGNHWDEDVGGIFLGQSKLLLRSYLPISKLYSE